jgi:hypothetical protein
MVIVNAIGSVLTIIINGVVAVLDIIISCLTCGYSRRRGWFRRRHRHAAAGRPVMTSTY